MSSEKAPSNGVEHVVGAATKLRRFLEQSNKILLCPGVYDGFSARIALQIGFDALYMVSSSSSSQFLC
jgi:2-methylisocitrate lyase-like PEP mutase family enzyme